MSVSMPEYPCPCECYLTCPQASRSWVLRSDWARLGALMAEAATGKRMEQVHEVLFFWIEDGRFTRVWSLEDTRGHMQQRGTLRDWVGPVMGHARTRRRTPQTPRT